MKRVGPASPVPPTAHIALAYLYTHKSELVPLFTRHSLNPVLLLPLLLLPPFPSLYDPEVTRRLRHDIREIAEGRPLPLSRRDPRRAIRGSRQFAFQRFALLGRARPRELSPRE